MWQFNSERFVVRRGLRPVATLLAVIAGLSSCELEKISVPTTEPKVAVHSVLNVGSIDQVVYVERTLNGSVLVPDTIFDPADPIVTEGGVPISDAIVEIIDSAGHAVQGAEDRLAVTSPGVPVGPPPRGTGVYRVPIAGSALVMGARYQLRVRTPSGEEATAFTRIPRADVRSSGGLTRTLNRDHDTLNAQWTAAQLARTYAVRIESPFGPFFLFTDSTHFRVHGELRNLFAEDLQRVLIPGFRQAMIVVAADSNFYDYYRTTNDPFTGTGIINRVSGGIGLFGAVIPLASGTLNVVADRSEPVEGRYQFLPFASTGFAPLVTSMTLYIESKAARADLPNALSGRYTNTDGRADGILGQELDGSITLSFLNNQIAGAKLDRFVGTLHGDTLVGSFQSRDGVAAFLRTP